jgi:rare lipoprotein A (peptidoglycan hydrolase)
MMLLILYPKLEEGDVLITKEKVSHCAHPYLPIGTKLKVVNLKNDRTLELVVDKNFMPRGNVILYISKSDAERLGIRNKQKIKINVIEIPKGKEKFMEIGYASWYGGKFQGRKTSCGITFNTYKYYAAHKTLPCGTIVKVKNLENGKSVRVEVVDRGPFKKNRIMDLSYVAARDIGILRKGSAKVEIEVVKWSSE